MHKWHTQTHTIMHKNFLASFYFLFGFITSFSMMLSDGELYTKLGGCTLFFYLAFNLLDALEDIAP
jgi:hypothetical protein